MTGEMPASVSSMAVRTKRVSHGLDPARTVFAKENHSEPTSRKVMPLRSMTSSRRPLGNGCGAIRRNSISISNAMCRTASSVVKRLVCASQRCLAKCLGLDGVLGSWMRQLPQMENPQQRLYIHPCP